MLRKLLIEKMYLWNTVLEIQHPIILIIPQNKVWMNNNKHITQADNISFPQACRKEIRVEIRRTFVY